ncbi:MAG: hypothetical protein GF344_04045 [Chitinivibrionales bacterium]|nr:hypothetical protein [Chitinivibrionales bacterium]
MDRYFFGHHKCATNWMRRYIRDLCKRHGWRCQARNGGNDPSFNTGADSKFVFYWNSWPADAESIPVDAPAVHLIRDPRDALVSGYWSWKQSHQENGERITAVRERLNSMSLEDGLVLMVEHITSLEQLAGWNFDGTGNIYTVRYEDMVNATYVTVNKMLEHWKLYLSEKELEELIAKHSFKAITGRSPGEEDTNHHFRKGVTGDWKNYFTDKVKARFKKIHGEALCSLGYESDFDW